MSNVQVTATPEPDSVPPRVRLDIVDSTSPLNTTTTITRLNPDGSTVSVRTADGNPLALTVSGATTVGLLYDNEPPLGETVTYSSLESPGNVSTAVQVDSLWVWLVHPGVPGLSLRIRLRRGSFQKRTRPIAQGVFYPMGRTNPIVVNGGARKGVTSSVGLLASNYDELAAIEALTANGAVLLLNIPATLGYNFATCYIAPGDIDENVLSDMVLDDYIEVVLPFAVVDRPVGGTTAARTYADLLVFPSYSALQAAYGTYADLLAGP